MTSKSPACIEFSMSVTLLYLAGERLASERRGRDVRGGGRGSAGGADVWRGWRVEEKNALWPSQILAV